jgi:hypothetical protein
MGTRRRSIQRIIARDGLTPYLGANEFGGEGSPEGVVYGDIGDRYTDTDAGELYLKTTGSSLNTGWQAPVVGLIVNADVAAGAAIAGTKISPAFGAQNISTTGSCAVGGLVCAGLTCASLTFAGGATGILHSTAGAVTSSTIVNADVNAAAAIAGTKINPNFGSQTVETTGVCNFDEVNAGDITGNLVSAGLLSVSGCTIRADAGTPEGAVTAPVGSLYLRTDGGVSTTLYVKTSGAGNTGWTAK